MPQPKINTYHCHCTTHLLTTTHTISTLPHRSSTSSSYTSTSSEIILPLPSSPPPTSNSTTNPPTLRPEGHTTLHSLPADPKPIIIRREDGFERRILYRCERCRLVIGYTIPSNPSEMDVDTENEGEEGARGYEGKVIYLLPGGLISSEFMEQMRKERGKKIEEEDVLIGEGKGVVVFE